MIRPGRLIKIAVFISAIFITALSYAEVIDKIIVVINNEVVTQREVDRMLAPVYAQYRTMYSGDELLTKLEEARQDILKRLIEDKLLVNEARKLNIEITDAEVTEKLEESQNKMGGKENFEGALLEQGLTMNDVKKRYKEQLMARKFVEQKVNYTIGITPIEAKQYYEAHKKEFVQPEAVRLRNILIRTGAGVTPEKALELAREIMRRLKEGGAFEGLAKEYSEGPNADEGGLMDYSRKGDLMPAVEKEVFHLKQGEMTGIIKTDLGYHIFKVEERLEPRNMEFSEARRYAEEIIYREKMHTKLQELMDNLKKNAYIAFK